MNKECVKFEKVLSGKKIILGVCGGIAAYKSVELLRLLQKEGADVQVVMTAGATEFVTELTFRTLSKKRVYTNLFSDKDGGDIAHIKLAEEADLVIIAPATANSIGKFAQGIADDALSTLILAVKVPVIICPSMNSGMYENRAVQRNLDILEEDGFRIVEPESGKLACGVSGVGRLPALEYIVDRIKCSVTKKDFAGKKILITAGPTREPIDPVRYIGNRSSGKMGYAIARAAEYRGADVVLVSGPVNIKPPINISLIKIETAQDMAKIVYNELDSTDIIIKVAAVADYRVEEVAEHKIKKNKTDDFILKLVKNPDILMEVGLRKSEQFIVGFAAETKELEKNACKKLLKKNLDIIVGNIVGCPESGFGTDTNIVTFFYKDGKKDVFPLMEKKSVANVLLDQIKSKSALNISADVV
ncbi:MAG: bifunctional 4'-phosphopantothenoylcysteine decarboxylase/phosphopantothenoylcysteine synthetase [Desulfobacteraceae bacterium 4572_19]|nr:MAG: bifunctional 4'-phosphopantothenoylcysteine decarboxylase/phosphopantothenoylcysteine synthetase [Desulfobacteraceae bacterium 4572_19]